MTINRRSVLTSLAAFIGGGIFTPSFSAANAAGLMPTKIKLGKPVAFSKTALLRQVKELAKQEYAKPPTIPQEWIDLSYDQYKTINFKPDSALWNKSDRPFTTEFFSPGLYFPSPIAVSIVDGGFSQPVLFSKDVFNFGKSLPELPFGKTLGYSGFRIRTAINDPKRKDEFIVFQGASYFRAVGKGQNYGLSARGLAINTAEAVGEEFPDFRSFWIEGGEAGSKSITVHALLDSPSVTGLYSFMITPGNSTEMNVEATIFPRKELKHVGIGAGTSMFLFDETNRNRFDDFRPAVHDSDGLLIENGAGETIWRPLANPVSLQVSNFIDNNPKGFGLLQRPRKFTNFADLEANYHKRPSLWVVPAEDWGKGSVTLVEIPADREIYDNIVAYWRPREPMVAGQQYQYNYRLIWCDNPPVNQPTARVINTRMGKRFSGGRLVTIDYEATDSLPKSLDEITLHVSSNKGKVSKGILQHNPATGGVRLAFTFDSGSHTSIELRAQLMHQGKKASEVWLYRWTP
ncbi:MAG: glucan biosynthesis protein G [Rhizobiaceae bacterium]